MGGFSNSAANEGTVRVKHIKHTNNNEITLFISTPP